MMLFKGHRIPAFLIHFCSVFWDLWTFHFQVPLRFLMILRQITSWSLPPQGHSWRLKREPSMELITTSMVQEMSLGNGGFDTMFWWFQEGQPRELKKTSMGKLRMYTLRPKIQGYHIFWQRSKWNYLGLGLHFQATPKRTGKGSVLVQFGSRSWKWGCSKCSPFHAQGISHFFW